MNIAALAVRRWQITLVGFLLLAILGLNAFLTIPRSSTRISRSRPPL